MAPTTTMNTESYDGAREGNIIPIIDLCGADDELLRPAIVEKIARASRALGIFQVVNHGIRVEVLENLIAAIKGFHELPADGKVAETYRRETNRGLSFITDNSKTAAWRKTVQIELGPTASDPESNQIPEICRNETVGWNQHVTRLGELLMGLLCEGLGVGTGRLKQMTFLEGKLMLGHSYLHCGDQTDLTMGLASHTDSAALTILLQDHRGGLQIKYGDDWVDVKPVHGALVINIGNLIQIISNDEYKSVEHRVLANAHVEPRISIGVFFHPRDGDRSYGPLAELISADKPAKFRQFTLPDYVYQKVYLKGIKKSVLNYYRLSE